MFEWGVMKLFFFFLIFLLCEGCEQRREGVVGDGHLHPNPV